MMMAIDTIIKLLTDSLLNCTDKNYAQEVPSSQHFLTHLPLNFLVAIFVASVLSFATIVIGIDQFMYVTDHIKDFRRRIFILYLNGTSPFVSTFGLVAIFMPKVSYLSFLLSFFYLIVDFYVIICLLLLIVDGRHSIAKKRSYLSIQTPPCCCLLPCLPKLSMCERKIRLCELMVMQMPCVRLVHIMLSLMLYFEYMDISLFALKILDFIALPSLLIGIYGCHILVTNISKFDKLCLYRYIYAFHLLDIFFLFFGLQQPIFEFLARAGIFNCGVPSVLPALDTAFFKTFSAFANASSFRWSLGNS